MTDRRRMQGPSASHSALDAFHAAVARLNLLSSEDFAALAPETLAPLVATIRATSSKETTS
ncbi:hypothetical protein [Geodermatophilus sp. URMC 62]|uniref:hypothetical protein n=1 Tax=Geodermatophilus sp. URMC 62 TaxID=3423414 RepID=UPI00406D4688